MESCPVQIVSEGHAKGGCGAVEHRTCNPYVFPDGADFPLSARCFSDCIL